MVINLITFASLLHKQASVRSSHEIILTELEKYFTVNFIDYQDINKLTPDDFSILFIATGGVERLVIQHFESLPRPAIILADGMQNSLAAALEISSWLRGRGMKSEILHGELSEIIKRIFVLHSNFMAQRSLFGMRIGVIGARPAGSLPATWIICLPSGAGEWNTPMSPLTASTNITLKSPMTKWAKHAPASPEKRLPAGKRPPKI